MWSEITAIYLCLPLQALIYRHLDWAAFPSYKALNYWHCLKSLYSFSDTLWITPPLESLLLVKLCFGDLNPEWYPFCKWALPTAHEIREIRRIWNLLRKPQHSSWSSSLKTSFVMGIGFAFGVFIKVLHCCSISCAACVWACLKANTVWTAE